MSVVTIQQRRIPEGQAGEYLGGISTGTLRNWRWSGRGPKFIKVGKSVRYDIADLDRFLDQNKHGGESESK